MIDSFLSHRVKGVVLLGSLLPDDEIQMLAKQLPTIAVGRSIDHVDCVLVDDVVGGRLAAEHIKYRGHAHIAHIDGGDGAGAAPRKAAFMDAFENNDGVNLSVLKGDYTQEGGYRCARVLFSGTRPPTAIFAANDLTALGVLGAAREFGLTAGKHFDLVGFDDIKLAAYDYISLTTISYSRADMGRIARELVQRRCADGDAPCRTIELPPQLIVRNTSTSSVDG